MAIVRYMVDDVDQAVEFYTRQLGFEGEERWGPAFAIVSKANLKLWLSGPQTSAAKPMPDGWNCLVIEVENIQATVSQLRESGARFRNEILSGPGGLQVLAEDPLGNPIELFQSAA